MTINRLLTYSADSVTDPMGPVEDGDTASRVVRGGSYFNPPGRCRSASRRVIPRGNRIGRLGFRLAAGQPEAVIQD